MTASAKKARERVNPQPIVWFWKDAAVVNNLGQNSFKEAIDSGIVPSRRVRGRIMVKTVDIERYIDSFPAGDVKPATANLKTKTGKKSISIDISKGECHDD